MHIHHLITDLGPGGAEYLVFALAMEQAESGHTVSVWTMAKEQPDFAEIHTKRVAKLAEVGVGVKQIGNGSRRVASAARNLRKELARSRRQNAVIHAHNAATAVVGKAGGRGLPVVLTVHAPEFRFPTPLWRVVSPAVSAWVAVSEASRDSLRPHVVKPVSIVKNGILLDSVTKVERNANKHEVELLSVGAIRSEKNYGRLIEAVKYCSSALASEEFTVNLSIAGGGAGLLDLAARARGLGLGDQVHLLGFREDVDELMQKSDVYVMASDFEGHPIALLDALASGLPSVVTPFATASDVLGGGVGVIASEFSSKALGESIAAVVRDPAMRKDLAVAGRKRAGEFSIEQCATRYEEVYRACPLDMEE